MEKIKLKNGDTYELNVNGIRDTEEKLTVCILSAESLEQLETAFSDPQNTERLELVTEGGELLQSFTGYTVLRCIKKEKDVFIETITAKEKGQEPQEIRSDVITAMLARSDLRSDLDEMRAEMGKRIEKIEKQQTIQDGAILDLAGLVGGGE